MTTTVRLAQQVPTRSGSTDATFGCLNAPLSAWGWRLCKQWLSKLLSWAGSQLPPCPQKHDHTWLKARTRCTCKVSPPHPTGEETLSTWRGGTGGEDECLTCVICRGNNKAFPDAQASPLSATSLSLTAAVLGAIQPLLSFTIRSILESSQLAKPFKRVHTSR